MPPNVEKHLPDNGVNGVPGNALPAVRNVEDKRDRFSHRAIGWGRNGRQRMTGLVDRPFRWAWSRLGPTAFGRLLAALFQLLNWPVRFVVEVYRSPRVQAFVAF